MQRYDVFNDDADGGPADNLFTPPLAAPRGADRLCRGFPGGGGREGAAGINRLAPERLDAFVAANPAA
ncbi:hypothetical protein ACEPT7_03710 [Burkholderia ubonensis]|uniref:hypothetical protein n=1 Tax=Burkholderia ubonensis TaxID=101571 RepID=UPI00358FA697